ncbi:M20 family metallopeptidase [Chengkuizengella axinellae]|uniref:Peptidase M20 domain-containing protein 2 n=1 Tax=Chengkuizengella axinellae TaxID=3064388 RepID=A0ABT9IU77_9BACL|nr:M20 family metallopeptidase [Chengkuizengella sp. 2205SS18-9]MDP5272903.1 M20 family metallopeptidase [Chengkuizengella sp. 2205SS18-9]
MLTNSQEVAKSKEEKQEIQNIVDKLDSQLRDISLTIHANPELGFNEHKAVQWLTAPLEKEGFIVERGLENLETAFVATYESNPEGPTIGIIAEYDALPKLGHACGHNIIGTSAVGAALALKHACPNLPGTIKVIGTPAEEGGGGKIYMCDQGVFDDVDAVMMCHPKNNTLALRGALARLAVTFKYYGKASHAAAAPEKGISALDAVINSFNVINSLRQFFTDDVRIHGVITKGGEVPNIVPDYCEAQFYIRAATLKTLEDVKKKVYQGVKNATSAVGATIEIEEGLTLAERNNNVNLANFFKNNLELMDIEVSAPPKMGGLGSSDIGNVSQLVPTIQPYIKIGEAVAHTIEFEKESKSEGGMIGLNQAAKAMAMTAYDLFVDATKMEQVREEFAIWKANQNK